MSTRRPIRAAIVGATAVGAVVGLLGLPAAATTSDAAVTGTIDLYDNNNTLMFDDLAVGAGVPCSTPTNDFTMSGSSTTGSWSLLFEVDETVELLGVDFRWQVEGDFSGGYTSTGLTGSGSLTFTLRPSTAPESCAYEPMTGTCTITATSVDVGNGVHTVSPPPMIDPGDTGAFFGSNGPGGDFGFEVAVDGSCGSLFLLDDGALEGDLDWIAV